MAQSAAETLAAEIAKAAFTPEALEAGRKRFAGGAQFLLSAPHYGALPPTGPVEVAFAGRSNVGKSSLINALTRQNGLAKTSNTPGRTQALNFFAVGEGLTLVDMPGYGYAKAPKATVDAWTALIHDYLRGRATLRRVYVLIDARHGIKTTDAPVFDTLDTAAVSYQVVLTKADKLKPGALRTVHEATGAALKKRPAAHPLVPVTSSAKGLGLDVLRADIAAFLAA